MNKSLAMSRKRELRDDTKSDNSSADNHNAGASERIFQGQGQVQLEESTRTIQTDSLSNLDDGNDHENTPARSDSFQSAMEEFEKGMDSSLESLEDASATEGMTESASRCCEEGQLEIVQAPSRHSEASSSETSRPLYRELTRVPSERLWDKPVQIKKPKTVLRRARLLAGKIVENPCVQLTIIWLIVINALVMGIGTFDFVTDNPKVERGFEITDRSFLIVFTVEIGLQLLYRGLSLFTDGWLIFDFVIVVASWSFESLQVIRAFRIFRAFRLITRLENLRELVMAIGDVMPRMYAIGMLLLLIFYIFAVLFTELFGDLQLSDNYFGSLDASLFTCMELMTLEWADIARQVMEQKSWAWLPFLAFISITGFIVFNLVVAVICDAVKIVDQQVRDEREREENVHVETDTEKLQAAQERVYDLSERVEEMKTQHKELQAVVELLANELATTSDDADSDCDDDSSSDGSALFVTQKSVSFDIAGT